MTFKEFTDFSHIVAIATSGNVYSYDAIEMLNIKPKFWKDLLTNEPFTKKDVITIQDPNNYNYKDVSQYYFIQNGLMKKEVKDDPMKNITPNIISEQIFGEIRQQEEEDKKKKEELEKNQESIDPNSSMKKVLKLNGSSSATFTSSSFTPRLEEQIVFEPKITTKKGFVSIVTNYGALNFTLHCDLTPLTCENFLTHCENEYYNNFTFHRSIKNFVLQGGDPLGTGHGGESIWKHSFPDEFHQSLKHEGNGVLSMANNGSGTNGSQFFITYKSAPHLDNKHTVFGNLLGGKEILKQLEKIETDENDKPLEKITILQTIVYYNPFSPEEIEKENEEKKEQEKIEKDKHVYGQWLSNPSQLPQNTENKENSEEGGIGKYITTSSKNNKRKLEFGEIKNDEEPERKKRKKNKNNYGDFSTF